MTNEEKARELSHDYFRRGQLGFVSPDSESAGYECAIKMAQWKDEQPISEQGGWHEEEPTEDGWYLVDTPDFPKNCHLIVAEWDNVAKHFYSEADDDPIDFVKWKLIEKD